jgi:hypothetical protein
MATQKLQDTVFSAHSWTKDSRHQASGYRPQVMKAVFCRA